MPNSKEKISELFLKLIEVMETLRGPQGCPWDREQTPKKLNAHLLEETYEVMEAVDRGHPHELKEELGDLLLQIVFHAQLGKEKTEFDMGDILESIVNKMIRRHPHVFGETKVSGVQEVLSNWERLKAEERKKGEKKSILSGVPPTLPALLKAYRLGEKASRVGFDWPNVGEVLKKMREELHELEVEVSENKQEKIKEEFGDLLFTLVNTARFLDVNPEDALRSTCLKFIRRFQYIESRLAKICKGFDQTNPEELDRLWTQAKKSTEPVGKL